MTISSSNERRLGTRSVSPIGLGAMWLSLLQTRPKREAAIGVIHAALDAGATLIDTADAYALDAFEMGHNERLVAEALRTWSGDGDAITVATKGGHVRDTAGSWSLSGAPSYLRRACEQSLRALDRDRIDVYYLHRVDPSTSLEDSVAALGALKDEGLIANVGLSNVSADQIARAREHCEVAVVQNEFSPRYRASMSELQYCLAHEIAFVPWRCLGGINDEAERGERYAVFDQIAAQHEVEPQEIALAWCLAQAPNVVVIPGATRPATIRKSVAAAGIELSEDELVALNATPHADVPSD